MTFSLRPRHAAAAVAFAFLLLPTLLSARLADQEMTEERSPERYERRFPLPAGSTVSVTNPRGLIEVTAYDGNEAVVEVYKHVDAQAELREWWLRESKVHLTPGSDRLDILVERPRRTCFGWCPSIYARVELRIRVPRQTSLILSGPRTDMRVTGVEGDLRVDNSRGELRVEDTRGAIRVSMSRGQVRLDDVHLSGNLEVTAERGSVRIDARRLERGAELSGSRTDIELRLPRDTGFELDYDGGRRSSFHSDFPLQARRFSDQIRASVNGGGPTIRIRSERGSVAVRTRQATL